MEMLELLAVGLPLVAGHGQMMHPPNWFMTDGLPRVCPMMEGADWGLGAMWYAIYLLLRDSCVYVLRAATGTGTRTTPTCRLGFR